MGNKLKILIVDDRSNILDTLAQYLEFNGFRTIKCVNAKESIDIAKKEKPDLMIVDIRMPEISGIELCKKLSKQKIILMTGYDDYEEKAAECKNAVGLIKKPIDNKELIAMIKKEFKIPESEE